MHQDIIGYMSHFCRILAQTVVTGLTGPSLSFAEGAEVAIGIITVQVGRGGKLIFVGNGGSAGIASHMAIDFWKNGGMRAVAFNDGALLTCIGNDFGYAEVFAKPVRMFAEPEDVLVAISSSGQSENILRAVEAGRLCGCRVITLSGFAATNPLRRMGDINFYVPASHYGFVEVGHQMILHALLDIIIERQKRKGHWVTYVAGTSERGEDAAVVSLDPTVGS
ncbi:SIS domain-containing protein [Thermodesulfitimonas autotrophica]|uniref:SIS domain-containing protein n=1 Tax=Thermodesulfitimonas autotrophica TaxID=1894989 RepID=UPI002FE27FB4